MQRLESSMAVGIIAPGKNTGVCQWAQGPVNPAEKTHLINGCLPFGPFTFRGHKVISSFLHTYEHGLQEQQHVEPSVSVTCHMDRHR